MPSALVALRPDDDVVTARVWHPSAVTGPAGEIVSDLWQAGRVVASIEHDACDRAPRGRGVLDSQHPNWTIDVEP